MASHHDKPPPYQTLDPRTNPGYGFQPPVVLPQQQQQQPPQVPHYGSMNSQLQAPPPQVIVVVGGCPSCRVGVLEDDYTFLGVCCAIVCFPIGILFCLAMKQRHCPNCGDVFT